MSKIPIRRLLAVDPSLTCSGWALFSIENGSLMGVGKIRSLPTLHGLPKRYTDLQQKITSLFHALGISNGDAVICEAETTMRDPRAAFRVEQVRGIFETLARSASCVVPGRINPRSVHFEVMGLKGKQLKREIIKETATIVARNLYKDGFESIGFSSEPGFLKKNQDIVDAVLIGHLGMVRIQSALRTGTEINGLFAQKR